MVIALNWDKCDKIFDAMGMIVSGDEDDFSCEYNRYCISVFDHWLTQAEYMDRQVAFSQINIEAYKRNLRSFFSQLYEVTSIVGVIRGDDSNPRMVLYDSIVEYLSYVEMGINDDLCLKLILPEMKIVMFSELNFTWPIFFHKTTPIDVKFLSLMHRNEIYLLENV